MKPLKKTATEAEKVVETYWQCYIEGDVAKMISLLHDDYTQIGSAEREVFYSRTEAIKFLEETIDQVADKAEVRNRIVQSEVLADFVLVTEVFDIYVQTQDEWAFYSQLRASTFLVEEDGHWKFIHQHSSVPDMRTLDGENIAIDKIAEENQELREAVKRRTVELEHQNRQLEIETSLERVRAKSLAMHKSEELQEVVGVVYDQLSTLGLVMDAVQIEIYTEEKDSLNVWVANDLQPYGRRLKLDHLDQPILKAYFTARDKGVADFTATLTKKKRTITIN
jgi:ketosteroid isomerase-like protein